MEKAGFAQVSVNIVKRHEINMEIVKSTIMDLTDDELMQIDGVSASALITAVKQD